MVHCSRGVLVTVCVHELRVERLTFLISDAAIREFLVFINKQLDPKDAFIIKELDETHLFVKEHRLDFVQGRLDELMDRNAFSRGQSTSFVRTNVNSQNNVAQEAATRTRTTNRTRTTTRAVEPLA